MFLSECSSRHRIIDHHIRQLEDERILSDGILIACHLKCGFDNTSYTADGAKTSAILLQLRKPQFRIRYFDGADFAVAEILFLDQIQNKSIADLGVVTNALYKVSVRRLRTLPTVDFRNSIRLPSDSISRWTPLPSANASCYRARSGLSPPSYRSCWAHIMKPPLESKPTEASLFQFLQRRTQHFICVFIHFIC